MGQPLQRNREDQWLKRLFQFRHGDNIASDAISIGVVFAGKRNEQALASSNFLSPADNIGIEAAEIPDVVEMMTRRNRLSLQTTASDD